MGRLQGKIALITGGNSGIGLATAQAFQREGATVVITGRSQQKLDEAKEALGGDVLALQGDVSDLAHLDEVAAKIKEQHGGLDIVFANAGLAKIAPMSEVNEAHYDLHMNTNVKGLFFTVQKMLPLLREGSSVILNASIVKDKGFPGFSVYTATKAAVRSFARTWTSEFKDRKIRVNSISPGPIETPLYGRMDVPDSAMADLEKNIVEQSPLGAFGEPADIAEAVIYLASNESKYTTGVDLVVDGGLSQI